MWRRGSCFILLLAGCAKLAGLEGSSSGGEPSSKPDATSPTVPHDAAASADGSAEAGEEQVLTFACGESTCTAGEQACCLNVTAACVSLDAGCASSQDAGADGGSIVKGPLRCTTYTNCFNFRPCCYEPTAGSVCNISSSCGSKDSLCTLGKDHCGSDRRCAEMPDPPQKGVGHCVDD